MKMTTLVIHAPGAKAKKGAPTFEDILATGVGPGYAIYESYISQLTIPGSKVVVLSNNKIGPLHKRERAEGLLVKLVQTTKTRGGIWRYDVYFEKWKMVGYAPEDLNRCGVAVIDC